MSSALRSRTGVLGPAPPAGRLIGYLALAAGVGAGAGVLWWGVARVPAYSVNPNGTAGTNERGLAAFVSGDAWFTVLGVLVGVGLGVLAWRLFRTVGWPVVPLALAAAAGAGLLCWWVGYELGPGPLPFRLAGAPPGSAVPIELTLRAPVALAAWPFAAALPLLLGASLGPDPVDGEA